MHDKSGRKLSRAPRDVKRQVVPWAVEAAVGFVHTVFTCWMRSHQYYFNLMFICLHGDKPPELVV